MPGNSVYRQRLDAASQSGFALLSSIPCTQVWRTLGYLDSLSALQRSAQMDDCAEIAQAHIESAFGIRERVAAFDASVIAKQSELHDRVMAKQYWSRFPDAFLRQLAANQEWLTTMVGAARMPQILACPVPQIAKAKELRPVLHSRFKSILNARPKNDGGGNWSVTGEYHGETVHVWLDYGGLGGGFRYGVNGLTLESTYGFASAKIDCPFLDQLDELADTMEKIVAEIVEIQAQLVT